MQLKILERFNDLFLEQEKGIKFSDIMFFNNDKDIDLSLFNQELPFIDLAKYEPNPDFEKSVLMYYIPGIYENPRT